MISIAHFRGYSGRARYIWQHEAGGNDNKDSPTMLTSETMSMLAMSIFIPTATGAPVKEGRGW